MSQDDDTPDLMEDIDHLDSDGSVVRLTARDGRPLVIWIEDADEIYGFLDDMDCGRLSRMRRPTTRKEVID